MDTKKHFSIRYFIVAMSLLLLVQTWINSSRIEALTYSDFKTLPQVGKLCDQMLSDTQSWRPAFRRDHHA